MTIMYKNCVICYNNTFDELRNVYKPRLTDLVTGKPLKRIIGMNGPGRTGKSFLWYWFGARQKLNDEALPHSIMPEEVGVLGDAENDDLELRVINGISGLEKIFEKFESLPQAEALLKAWIQFLTKDDVQGKFFPHLNQSAQQPFGFVKAPGGGGLSRQNPKQRRRIGEPAPD